jgi:hypothetical protein
LRDPATQFYGARPTFFRHPLCLTSQGSGSQRFATRGLSAQGFYAHDPERNLARRSQRSCGDRWRCPCRVRIVLRGRQRRLEKWPERPNRSCR